MRDINPEHYFVLCNGQIIKNLRELSDILKTIDKKTFEYHVNAQKNDFSNWIRFVFKSKKLAETIEDYNFNDRKKIIAVINNSLKEKKILVLNAGSSSLKFQLIEITNKDILAKGIIERINTDKCSITININGNSSTRSAIVKNHEDSVKNLIDVFLDSNIISDISEITAIGHRVVHGGESYKKPVLVDNSVIEKLKDLSSLAPLHNPANVNCILACQRIFSAPQIAVFDTAFHSTIPKEKFLYGLPYSYYEKYKIRKYGFHGISHQYVNNIMQEYYKIRKKKNPKIIICHLGNGCSITAIKNKKSYNTTMGFTPVDGLVMGTRVGSVDPVVSMHLGKLLGVSYDELSRIFNKESGLLGISGYSDMRELWNRKKDPKCRLAMKMFVDRLVHYIGAYIAELNGINAIVFTAGIGENAFYIRKSVLDNFTHLGIKLDNKKNEENDFIITSNSSKIESFVVQTNEEIQIAMETKRLLKL